MSLTINSKLSDLYLFSTTENVCKRWGDIRVCALVYKNNALSGNPMYSFRVYFWLVDLHCKRVLTVEMGHIKYLFVVMIVLYTVLYSILQYH